MLIHVKLFGPVAEAAGMEIVDLRLSGEATVAHMLDRLAETHEELDGKLASVAVAVNHRYATREQVLAEADEVAVIPPVSGG